MDSDIAKYFRSHIESELTEFFEGVVRISGTCYVSATVEYPVNLPEGWEFDSGSNDVLKIDIYREIVL